MKLPFDLHRASRKYASSPRLTQRRDDLPVSRFRERFQRMRSDVSQHAQLQVESCGDGIVGSFVNRDDIIIAHSQKKRFELSVHILESFLRHIEATRRVLYMLRTLICPGCKHDVCRHGSSPCARGPADLYAPALKNTIRLNSV